MNAENKLAELKEKNRIRQQRYYEKNKAKVNENRRNIYKAGRDNLKGIVQEPIYVEPEPEPEPEKEIDTEVNKIKKIDFSKNKMITFDEANANLENVIEKKSTLVKYKSDFKRLILITGCGNIIQCFKNHKKLIKEIENAKQPNGNDYALNTKKSLIQTILFIITHFNLKIPPTAVKAYKNIFEIYKVKSIDATDEKYNEKSVLKFSEYLEKVKGYFGDNSKMYLLAALYNEVTIRDDMVLKIVTLQKNIKDNTNNILVSRTAITLFINSYKTAEKYGQIKVKLSHILSNQIRNYITTNNLKEGDYLFGDKKLSSFITNNNLKIGVIGGVSLMRQMKISEELDKNKSAEKRIELAEKMKHSPIVQLRYLRKLK